MKDAGVAVSRGARSFAAGLFLLAHGTATAADPYLSSVGAEFQVNTYTTDRQRFPSVAAVANGGFVVVWQSDGSWGSDTSYESIQGQRYDSAGAAVGSQFQVNTYTILYQGLASVAADADGDFVVVWQSDESSGGDTSNSSVQGQRYDSTGTAVGGEFQINTYTTGNQGDPSVAADADGDFVVVWQSNGSSGSDTSSYSIHGQRYDSGGAAAGSQFQVNSYTIGSQRSPAVAADADGDFVVVWQSGGSSGSDTSFVSVQGQRYDSGGNALGTQFQVNSYTIFYQGSPSVVAWADGDFVVVWQSDGSSGDDVSGRSIQGQRYDSAGSAVGDEFQVNTYTTHGQYFPVVTAQTDGGFVVVWPSMGSSGSDTSNYSVQGKRYDNSGNSLGSQFQVNTYTTSSQAVSSIAASSTGEFVVVWLSAGSSGNDTSDTSIQGQRYATVTPVPSLSPAGIAAAALLVCLAVGLALRRRV